jgi:hypothetical protein
MLGGTETEGGPWGRGDPAPGQAPVDRPARDPAAIPLLSLIFGFGPMLPILAAGIAALVVADPLRAVAIVAGTGWASGILIFIAGVRRGYGFAIADHPRPGALTGTFFLFAIGMFSLPLFLLSPILGVLLLIVAYAAVAILDRAAALRGEAPRHFARLRPPQMAVGLLGLAMIEVACLSLG